MKQCLPLLILSLLGFTLNAQTIRGIIRDNEEKTLPNATVTLHRAKDSSVAKLAVTDKEGRFVMSGVRQGKYLVSASYVGHRLAYSTPFDVAGEGEIVAPMLTLQKSETSTNDVTVTARKPLVEVKADKTIFNVEGTINAIGQDVLELLRKAPGIQIDKDDNISISGKNGVQVFIDGKPSPLAGKDLSEYLKSLQSAQVESIEIITNPSAKYEAAGNAGIINIRLKRNKSLGTNGSVNAGYGIGIFSKYNGGLALNHRSKTLNLFGTYNMNRNRNESPFHLFRDVADSLFDQNSKFSNRNESHNFKVGADFLINRFNTIGVMINGVRVKSRGLTEAHNVNLYKPTNTIVKELRATNQNYGHRENTTYNLNFKHADTLGRDLNIDFDYSNFDIASDQLLTNVYYDAAGAVETNRNVKNTYSPTQINIYSSKIDYEQHFKKGRLGIGGKTAFVNTDNDFQRFNFVGGVKEFDRGKSNRFRYDENINAAYINYNRQLKGWMYQVGLRAENTITRGTSNGRRWDGTDYVAYDSSFKRNYTNLFPSASLTFNKNPKNQWSFSYSRRIDRPAYQDLNPFEFELDDYSFMKGNTELTPQFTHSFSVTNIYRFKLTTSLSYSHTDDVFAQITDVTQTSKSYLTKKNLASQDNVGLNISYPFQYKAFSLYTNVNAYWSHFEADYGPQRKIDIDIFSYRIFGQGSVKLSKTLTAELSGWYSGPSVWGGTFESKPMGQIDMGLQKTIFKGKGTVRAALSDVFKTFRFAGESRFGGQYTYVEGSQESRVFRINFSYRFGNNQVKAARNRKTAADEENSRTQGSGGLGGN